MKQGALAATGKLLKIYLRSGMVLSLLLILLPFLFSYAAAASNIAVLRTPEQLSTYIAENQGNPLLGFISANTIAGVTVWRIRTSTTMITSILTAVLVINGTRRDEEEGRLELLCAGAVGSKAPLTAVLIKGFGVNLLGGLTMALGFLAAGFPVAGSLTAGMAVGLCNCCFAAAVAIAAQTAPNARLARGFSFGAIVFFLLLQVIANVAGNETLLLFTPFGWCAYARPFAGENALLFLFAVPATALLTAAAYALSDRRDLGGSYIRERGGRTEGSMSFQSPLALAWRIQRGTLLVWLAAYAVMGLVIAALVPGINKMLDGTAFLPELSAALGGAGRAFLAILAYILTQVLAAYTILAFLRVREEESATRAELVLSGAASRIRYAGGHLLIAFAGSALALSLFGLCIGDFVSCIARLPAVWLIASVTVLLYGIAPRAAVPAGWGLFGASLLLEFLWEMKIVGNRVFALSPFSWFYPGVPVSPIPVLVMLLIAAAFAGLGLVCFSKRDLTAQ